MNRSLLEESTTYVVGSGTPADEGSLFQRHWQATSPNVGRDPVVVQYLPTDLKSLDHAKLGSLACWPKEFSNLPADHQFQIPSREKGGCAAVVLRNGLDSRLGITGLFSVQGEEFTSPRPVLSREPPREKGRLLVIDDEESVRSTIGRILNRFGYQTVLAASGAEGVGLFAAEPRRFQAVILDLTMPGMGGVQTFEALQRIDPKVKVLLSSGYSGSEVSQLFTAGRLAGFLQKPLGIDQLVQGVEAVL